MIFKEFLIKQHEKLNALKNKLILMAYLEKNWQVKRRDVLKNY